MAKHSGQNKKGPVPHKVLSDRGVFLEQRHNVSENSNIHHGATAFSFLNDSGQLINVKVGQQCPVCKKRVRGIKHEDGDHHKGISSSQKTRY